MICFYSVEHLKSFVCIFFDLFAIAFDLLLIPMWFTNGLDDIPLMHMQIEKERRDGIWGVEGRFSYKKSIPIGCNRILGRFFL